MGDKGYAAEMARLLDPGGALLRPGRLISAQDCSTGGVKSLDVVLGGAAVCVILDDSPSVWRVHSANVVAPDRYHFFPGSAQAHGESAAGSHLARGSDEAAPDGTLFALSRLIRRLHAAMFDGDGGGRGGGDVRPLLRAERRRVLAGCRLLFSGIVPRGGRAEAQPLWQLGLELGAECVQEVDPGRPPTHLLAPTGGTEKGRWAAAAGLPCVTPAWLRACGARWERARESEFALPPPPPRAGPAGA